MKKQKVKKDIKELLDNISEKEDFTTAFLMVLP